jgi:hypothetical protein
MPPVKSRKRKCKLHSKEFYKAGDTNASADESSNTEDSSSGEDIARPTLSKAELRARQVEFVIHKRDNNKPDLNGNPTTTGKLEWAKVAALYNEEFDSDVNRAAVEKRYRTNIDRYCAQNPNYPRNIIYAPKMTKRTRSKKQDVQKDGPPPQKKPRPPAGTFRPAQRLIDAGGLDAYIESLREASDAVDLPENVVVSVIDGHDGELGSVIIPSKVLAASSKFYQKHCQTTKVREIEIRTSSKATVERYAQCITPAPRAKLPQYDFALVQHRTSNDIPNLRGVRTSIEWDLEALVNLYLVAVEFDDDHVRNLILDHWFDNLVSGGHLELDTNMLNTLFLYAPYNSHARKFWALVLHAHGFSDHICNGGEEWSSKVKKQLRVVMAAYPVVESLEWTKEEFCREFHQHADEANCFCKQSLMVHGSDPPDYGAIADRMVHGRGLVGEEAVVVAKAVALDFRSQRLTLRFLT